MAKHASRAPMRSLQGVLKEDPDQLVERLTGRLIEIEHGRILRQRIKWILVASVILLCTGALAVWANYRQSLGQSPWTNPRPGRSPSFGVKEDSWKRPVDRAKSSDAEDRLRTRRIEEAAGLTPDGTPLEERSFGEAPQPGFGDKQP